MIDLVAVICGRLNTTEFNNQLTAGPEGEPAMYAEGLAPAPFPYTSKCLVIIGDPDHEGDEDTFDEKFRRETVALRLYHKPDGDYKPLHDAAEWVRERFQNWGSHIFDGGEVINTTVSGPTRGPTSDPTLAGRIVTLNFLIKEN